VLLQLIHAGEIPSVVFRDRWLKMEGIRNETDYAMSRQRRRTLNAPAVKARRRK
jgi:hypothetical protein